MHEFLNSPFKIGNLTLANRLIQGPLAGYTAAPLRKLVYQFLAPAYCVSEMISAKDVLTKHLNSSRYLYRAPEEKLLCYQIAGDEPFIMAEAAKKLVGMGADLIDINCGCPKTKIRKKGAGSALLDKPDTLINIVSTVRMAISIPLTVKVRIQADEKSDLNLARLLENEGIDALIIHGRHWQDDYDRPVNLARIAAIKASIKIPVIANGDILDKPNLMKTMENTAADAYMIGRAATGKPWLFQQLLSKKIITISSLKRKKIFLEHLEGLAKLENEFQALLQSRSLFRYYFGKTIDKLYLNQFYQLKNLDEVHHFLNAFDV